MNAQTPSLKRKSTNLSLDPKVWNDFKVLCLQTEGGLASRRVEDFMRAELKKLEEQNEKKNNNASAELPISAEDNRD